MYPNTRKKQPLVAAALAPLLVAGFSIQAMAQANPPSGDGGNEILQQADSNDRLREVSPIRRIDRDAPPPPDGGQGGPPGTGPGNGQGEFRSFDGTDNNLGNPVMGATLIWLERWIPADYADGLSEPAGDERPGARIVSNGVSAQDELMPNEHGTSDFLWQWGQFLDHDIDLTDGAEPAEPFAISVPEGDPWFDPQGTGAVEINLNRSLYDHETGVTDTPRQQVNEITAWIDASNVYGSDSERAAALRRMDGSGKLKSSPGGLLPFNVDGLANAGGASDALFLAGDVRANEQIGLTAMHTLFMREHNRLCDVIGDENPGLDGDAIYQRARKLVGAEMQIITYREYLPELLGREALRPYGGYRDDVDASISNIFATAAYRYGHSALSPTLLRLDAQGEEIAEGHIELRDAFFSSSRLSEEGGIAPVLRGLAAQLHQAIDPFVIDDVRNFLFGPPGAGGFDLAALNIQRGRDHGLPSYNEARVAMGLEPFGANQFRRVTSNREIERRLRDTYDTVNDIDAWVGGLAEDPVPGAQVGPLIHAVLTRQFEALRDADRFWWELTLTPFERDLVADLKLADIIRLNTPIGDEIQDNVFRVASTNPPAPPPRPGN